MDTIKHMEQLLEDISNGIVVSGVIGSTNTSDITTIDNVQIYFGQTIAVSTIITSIGYDIRSCKKIDIYFENTGTSTDLEIITYGSPTSDLTLKKQIGEVIKLGAGESGGPVINADEIPGYISFSIKNVDANNTGILYISLYKYISGYTQTNTTLYTNQSIATQTSITSSDVSTSASKRVNIYCSQSGTSTNTTFCIYGKSNSSPAISKLIAMGTLGASSQWGCGILSDIIPGSIYTTVTNSDSSNTATVTVLIESFT